MNEIIKPRRTYGRRAKPFGPVRAGAMERLPEYEIDLNGAAPGTLDPQKTFPFSLEGEGGRRPDEGAEKSSLNFKAWATTTTPSPAATQHPLPPGRGVSFNHVHLEIGAGTGEHVAELAAANPADLFLAAEPYQAGVANLMRIIIAQNIPNIRIYPNDGLALLKALQTASIDHAYLLFPDPWPKTRHSDRRFLQAETLAEFTRVVRPGGSLLLASDDPGMQAWMHTHMASQTEFTRQNHAPHEPITRYAAKGLAAGKTLQYLYFIRK
jgi:tRNA (guanine-N7-)-methyltransferase